MKKMKKLICLGILLCAGTLVVAQQKIKCFDAYLSASGGMMLNSGNATRYVAVYEDNSIYWFAKDQNWAKTPTDGLPAGYNILAMDAYSKEDGGRLVVVLSDGTIWWYCAGNPWKPVTTEGLPKGKAATQISTYLKMDGIRYVVVMEDNTIFWSTGGKPWEPVPLEGLPK